MLSLDCQADVKTANMLICSGRVKLGLQQTRQARRGKIGSLLLVWAGSGEGLAGCRAGMAGGTTSGDLTGTGASARLVTWAGRALGAGTARSGTGATAGTQTGGRSLAQVGHLQACKPFAQCSGSSCEPLRLLCMLCTGYLQAAWADGMRIAMAQLLCFLCIVTDQH